MNDTTGLRDFCHYAWSPAHEPHAHHRLTVSASSPSAAEAAAFRAAARWELALLIDGPAIVLLWRTPAHPWSEAPYSWHLQGTGSVPSTAHPGGSGLVPIDCLLIDSATRRQVSGVRHAVPWSLMGPLHAAIAAQAAAPWSEAEYDATLSRLSAEPCEALVARAQHRCAVGGGRGGDPGRQPPARDVRRRGKPS